jgi:hypothetical protein
MEGKESLSKPQILYRIGFWSWTSWSHQMKCFSEGSFSVCCQLNKTFFFFVADAAAKKSQVFV